MHDRRIQRIGDTHLHIRLRREFQGGADYLWFLDRAGSLKAGPELRVFDPNSDARTALCRLLVIFDEAAHEPDGGRYPSWLRQWATEHADEIRVARLTYDAPFDPPGLNTL